MTNSDFFKENGFNFFKNILPIEECNYFADLLLKLKEENKLSFEGKTISKPRSLYDNSFGIGSLPEMQNVMHRIQPIVENQIDTKIKPSHTFARIYYNGGTLRQHIDRAGLDYTMSVTLRSNLDQEWPLYWKDLKSNTINMEIKQGDGALILGRKMKHWRYPLACDENQYFAALFIHWSIID